VVTNLREGLSPPFNNGHDFVMAHEPTSDHPLNCSRDQSSMQNRPPIFVLIFISIFGFIGLSILIGLWTTKGFGEPPIFFKIFGSFIAIAFMAMGFGVPITALRKGDSSFSMPNGGHPTASRSPRPPNTYDCPHCGANVGKVEVSPSGDIKCSYCNEWWNTHQK
jgi:hypothetical protein